MAKIEVHVGHPRYGTSVRAVGTICWPEELRIPEGAVSGPATGWGRSAALPGSEGWSTGAVGCPVGGPALRYEGLGYPRFAEYGDGGWGVEQLGGVLPPLGGGVGGGFVLDQRAAPRLGAADERTWNGASGAAVFCEGLLVAVVVKDDEEFENRRLHALQAEDFACDPEFVDLVRQDTGVEPVLEPVELTRLLDTRLAPVPASTPGSLLTAAAEVVGFHGRDATLRQVAAWRDSDRSAPPSTPSRRP